MLASFNPILRFVILSVLGAIVGAFINWAIYAWALTRRRQISPWQKPKKDEPPVTPVQRIPIIGWWYRRNTSVSNTYGNGFWVRPFIIETTFAIAMPFFYLWIAQGGLTLGAVPTSPMIETWFWSLSILITLMCIGTFIDFDEKMIPDPITIPGTLIALTLAALAPHSRLPEVTPGMANTPTISPVHYQSPDELVVELGIHNGTSGLWIALAIFVFWIFALWPKFSPFYVGLWYSIRYSWAHSIRPRRKTTCPIRVKPRKLPGLTKVLGLLLLAGLVLIPLAWKQLPAANWESLFGALVGLLVGCLTIWGVRIVGTVALQQEAMGFGDVTLMAMIGAFLGWQASLIVFALAPFVAILIVIIQFCFTRNKAIPFGPYLCGAALLLIYFWGAIWPGAASGVFVLGHWLFYILAACLVLMAVMLWTWAWLRGDFRDEVS